MLTETIQHSYGGENDHLDLLLHDLIRAVDSWPSECQSVFEEFRGALEQHIRSEERLLFPIYEQRSLLKSHSPTAKMRSEHRQLQVLMDEIQQKLDARDWCIDLELTVLKNLLTQHCSAEELVVYSRIDEVLTTQEREAIISRPEREGVE